MRFLTLLLALTVLMLGCGGGGGATDNPNILRVGNGAEVQDLDPHLVSGVTEHRVLTSLFEGLVDLDAALKPVPGVAESWTVSDDGRVYTFTLRGDAKWSNGNPLTAHDFVYSWQRMLSPALGAEYAYLLHCLKNGRAFNEGKVADPDALGVKALDDHTLEVTLENPTPYFLGMQIHFAWFPVNQKVIETFGAKDERGTRWTRQENFVGNGPFKLAEWRPNEVIRVVRNPYYWDRDNVKLDGIDFYPIDNEQTEERKFRVGDLDITSTVPLYKVKPYQEKHPELIHLDPYLSVYFYRLNTTRAPFTDRRVRRAFSMAVDREELVQNVLKAGERPACFLTPPDTAGYTCTSRVPHDPEGARALLAEAGYPNGEGLPVIEILYNTMESHKLIAETLQRQWKETLGVEVRLMNQDWKVYLSSMNNLDYSVARSGWTADVDDPVNFLECFLSGQGNNRTGFSNAGYDRLINAAYAEADPKARLDLLQRAEAILLDESPVVPLYFPTRRYLMAPAVKGYTPNLLGYLRWKDFYLTR